MLTRSPSPSPPPYNHPERQRLLGGSTSHAVYSPQVSPDGPRPNKYASRYSETDQEPPSDDPRSTGRYYHRSFSSPSADDSSHIRCPIWMTVLLLLLVASLGFYSGQPSDTEHNSIRERWEVERQNHTNEVEKWYKDRDARRTREAKEVERFKKEEQDLIDRKQEMIANYNHTEHELVAKKRKMIDDYTLEEERWLEKMSNYKNKEKDLIRRQEEMEDIYRNREQAWRQKITRFEEEWQRMVDEENRKRERARLYWDDINGDEHCLSNGRKKYTARLANLTPSLDAMEACKSTPITLNGVTYDHPIICENTELHGIRGHWVADNEGVCAAYWEFVKIKDCTAPGSSYRRIEAKLGVVHTGENPEILCLTTPLYINGKTYSRPMACPNWGAHGYWGIWNIPDDQCK